MSRMVSLRWRADRRAANAQISLVLFSLMAIVPAVASSRACADDQLRVGRFNDAESHAIDRLLPGFAPTTIRVFVDGDERMPLDISQLREIDDEAVTAAKAPSDLQLKHPESASNLFAPPRGSEWIGATRPLERDLPLTSLREDGIIGLQPVSRLSIPNPLSLIGNPLQWGGRFRAEYGTNFDDLDLLRGNLIVQTGLPVGFDTEFNYRNDDVRSHSFQDFWTGDFNIVYRFGKIRYAEIRAGVGINWLAANNTTDFGFNATYGVDFNIKKPWIISTSFDWGTLGSESLLHMRATIGLDLGRFELYTGYDFYEVGSREWKAVVAGVGMWF